MQPFLIRRVAGTGLLLLLLVGCLASKGWAQGINRVGGGPYSVIYRPDSVAYRIHEGPQFDLIYQAGSEGMATRTARALRDSWRGTKGLFPHTPDAVRMPVVINDFNDRSNGYVVPAPFKQELEAPSIKTDAVGPRARSWPALVGPHELVHATHAEVQPTIGVGGLLRLFSPDAARGLNLLAPRGLTEGVAVYRETQYGRGGRLANPLFTMKMKAAMLSDDPWSLTQMLEPPAYTQPFNRYYIGGAHAFEHLATRGDSTRTSFFETVVSGHNRLPFVGHGVWLGAATGQFPYALRDELQTTFQERYRSELERRAPFAEGTAIAAEEGVNYRRPYWLGADTLVAYVQGYDVRPGLYRVDARTGARRSIRIQELTQDRVYRVGPDTSALYASRYVQAPLVPRQSIAEAERIDLSTGAATRLTNNGRVLAPTETPSGSLLGVRNDGPFTRWVALSEEGASRPLTPRNTSRIREMAASPEGTTLAVVRNDGGEQEIYRAPLPVGDAPQMEPWLSLQHAAVYDLSWGPQGRYLLFAADLHGSPNVFALDTRMERVLQITNVRYGALEPSLSPDQSTVAFVNYRHERHTLARIPFRPDSASVVPDSLVQIHPRDRSISVETGGGRAARPDTARWGARSSSRSYEARRHLGPRMVYPTLRGTDGELGGPDDWKQEPVGLGVGVGVAGTDPLQRWTYQGRTWWQDGRLWGEARLQTGAFLLRPSISAYDRPFTTVATAGGGPVAVGVEERGTNLGLRLPATLRSNVYSTRLRVSLNSEVRQTRLFGPPLSAPTPYTTRVTLTPRLTVGYRLQQNQRDVVPNTGTVLSVRSEIDAWTSEGPGSRALIAGVDTYLPLLRDVHTGLRVGGRLLAQNRGAIYNLSTFGPRGYDLGIGGGTFLQLEAEVTQPLWYIDEGLTLLPMYAKVLSIYGFGEMLGPVGEGRSFRKNRIASIGGGLSLEVRLFYLLNLDLRAGLAYRPGRDDIRAIYR